MALTEEEVKKLEEEANLARRRNIAAANLADARDISGKQRAYNQMRAESDMAAHERFMERRRAFAERNPLAVPGEERRRLQLQADRGSLRAHEMAMLDKRNAGNLAVAKENRGAAREQGMEAAKATAEANIKLGEINKGIKEAELKNQLTMHEQTMANNLAVADKKGALDKELETIRTQGALKQAEIKNKHEARLVMDRNQTDQNIAARNAEASIMVAREGIEGKKAEAYARIRVDDEKKAKNALVTFLRDPVNKRKWEGMSDEEKDAWFAERYLVNPL